MGYGHHAVGKAATAAVGVLYSTGCIVVHARSEVLLFLRLHLRFLAKIMTVVISGSHQGCWLVNPLSPPLLHPSQPPSNAPPCPLPPAHRPLEAHRVPPLPKVSIITAQEISVHSSLNAYVIITQDCCNLLHCVGYKQQLAVPDTDPFEPLEKEYRLSILEPQDDTSSTSTEGSSDEASKVARGFLIPAKLGINRLRVTEVQTGRHGLRLVDTAVLEHNNQHSCGTFAPVCDHRV